MIVVDPNDRITADKALKHPWIANADTDKHMGDQPLNASVI